MKDIQVEGFAPRLRCIVVSGTVKVQGEDVTVKGQGLDTIQLYEGRVAGLVWWRSYWRKTECGRLRKYSSGSGNKDSSRSSRCGVVGRATRNVPAIASY